jgi:hypothetical protein
MDKLSPNWLAQFSIETCATMNAGIISKLRLLRLPQWIPFTAWGALLYFYCFYRMQAPFACPHNVFADCSQFWPTHPVLYTAFLLVLHGTPGLIAIALFARSSSWHAVFWLLLLSAWSFSVHQTTFEMNGYRGCENCDYGLLFMIAVSWLSLIIAITIASLRSRFLSNS